MSSGRGRPGTATARKDASIVPDRMAATAVVDVEQRHDVELDLGVRAVEVAQQARRREPREAITSTRSGRRPGRTDATAALGDAQQLAGVGQERLPVDGELRRRAAVRVNSRTPRSRSSAAMRLETACWVIASSAAASWNCPASAAATKVRTASRSTPTTLVHNAGCGSPADRLFDLRLAARFDLTGQRRFVRVGCRGALSMAGSRRWGGGSGGCGRRTRSARSARGSAFGAFPLIAILVLHAGPAEVSALAAAGLAVGAVVAVPLGPWVEFRRKRPVMIAMDLTRFAALMSVPAAYALGRLSFAQLLVVSVVVAAADIAFNAASGAYLKALVRAGGPARRERAVRVHDLDRHRARTAARRGRDRAVRPGDDRGGRRGQLPALGRGASARSAAASRARCAPERTGRGCGAGDLLDGWRHILTHPALRPLFLNTVAGQRPDHGHRAAARRAHARRPRVRALAVRPRVRRCPASAASSAHGWPADSSRGSGSTRSCSPPGRCARAGRSGWPSSGPGVAGLVLVIAVELGLVTCMGVFNPVFATYRLDQTADGPGRPHPVRLVGHQQAPPSRP